LASLKATAPPYQENWNFLQLLCRIPAVASMPMVLTTVNKAALEKSAAGRMRCRNTVRQLTNPCKALRNGL
jgi:hypothetical protein